MKKIIRLITVAASTALALTACSKNEALAPEAAKTVHVRVSGAPEAAEAVDPLTKTFVSEIGTNQYSVKWDNKGEALGIVLGELTDKSKPSTLTAEETEDNDPIFEGDVTAGNGATKAFLFYPASAYAKSYNGSVGLELKATQNPILGSYDPACDLLVWATDAAKVEGESLVLENLTLQRPMALLRVNLNAPAAGKAQGQTVTGLKMSLPSLTLTGRVRFDDEGAVKDWTVSNSYVEAVIDPAEMVTVGESDGFNAVWLVVNPVTIPSGTEIQFKVETEDHNGAGAIKRTVTAPSDMVLEAGKVNVIDLTIRDKDIPGDVVVVDYSGDWLIAGGQYYAAKKYDSGNNLRSTAFTLSADGSAISSEDPDFADCKMTFTLVDDGDYKGLYTIKDAGGKYLYAASPSSNHLKGKAEPDANAYWEVLKEGENYSIVATKSSNRNVMQFNAGNNPPIFACYSSASQTPIVLYPWSMVKVNTDPVITFGETEKTVAADATSVLFTYNKNAYVTEEPTVSVVSGADCLDGEIIVLDGTITVPLKANTEAVEKTIALSVSGQGIAQAVSLTITQQAFVPVTATTVAEILAAGEGTYDLVENLLVYSVAGSNAIVGDATGKMLLYKSGMTVGDLISISGAVVTDFNGILEINGTKTTDGGGSFTTVSQGNAIDHGTPADLDDDSVASSVAATFQATGYHSAAYVKMTGAKSGGKTVTGKLVLYLNQQNTNYDGQDVKVEGYIYSYASKFSNYNFQLVSLAEADPKPSLAVDPEALSWNADEYGSAKAKTATVTLNAGATGYTVTGSSSDWTVSDNGAGVITAYPNATNTSESAAKTLTLTIAHKDDATLTKELVLTQAKVETTEGSTDILTNGFIGVTGTSYTEWNGKAGTSGAVYAGKSAGGNNSIQLRSKSSDSGIISTTSGGKVTKVSVKWNSASQSGRTLSIYGRTSAYSEVGELYDNSKQGTLLGQIVNGTSTELEITGEYTYIGLRSKSDAMYLDEIAITWK